MNDLNTIGIMVLSVMWDNLVLYILLLIGVIAGCAYLKESKDMKDLSYYSNI